MHSRFVFAPIERQPPWILHACKKAGARRPHALCVCVFISQQSQSQYWGNQMKYWNSFSQLPCVCWGCLFMTEGKRKQCEPNTTTNSLTCWQSNFLSVELFQVHSDATIVILMRKKHIYIYIYIYVYIYMCVCVCICVCVCVDTHTRVDTHTHTHIYIY